MLMSRFASRLSVLLLAWAVIGGSQPAFAQTPVNDPCVKLGETMQARMKLIEQIQGFKDKKPTADQACSVFTRLSRANKNAIAGLERDGAWCRAPETVAASLKEQQSQIDTGRSNACKVAADQKKLQQQQGAAAGRGAQTGPLGGTGDVLGGPQKLPQGAL